jgi:hypothetical protein
VKTGIPFPKVPQKIQVLGKKLLTSNLCQVPLFPKEDEFKNEFEFMDNS